MRRRYSHIQEKCLGSAATLSTRRCKGHAMRHAADSKRLDQRLTVRVAPNPARVAPDQFLIRGIARKPLHVGPLPNDVFTVGRFYDRAAVACQSGFFRPGPAMWECPPHGFPKRLRVLPFPRKLGLKCL